MFSFNDLELKFGPAAYRILAEIEKAALIPSWKVFDLDPEARLAHALRVQDSMIEHARLAA